MRSTVRALALAAIIAQPGLQLHAQTAPRNLAEASLEQLMNITITTATRTAEGAATAPARVQVVTRAQIERRGYRSVAELLKDLPEFKVELAGDQDYPTQLTVQGTYGASRVVLLLDGIRVSSPTNEPLPILANYPVHSARQIEIVFGPASALYGADAFSAVINIISRTADDAPGLTTSTAMGQFGLFNQTASYGVTFGRNTSLMLAGQFLYDRQPDLTRYYPADFQGLAGQRTGTFNTIFGPMTPPDPVSPDYEIPLSAHSIQATLRNGGLQLMLFQNHSRVSTTPAYTPDNGVYSPDAFNRNKLLVIAGSYTRQFGRFTSTSTATVSRHKLDPESGYWNVYSNMKRSYKYAFGSMAKIEEQLSWNVSRSIGVTTGGTFESFYAIPQGADLNAPVRSHNGPGTILDTNIVDDFIKLQYSNSGAFGQMRYAISPAATLTLGARADYNTRYGATFNPRAGLVVQPASGTTIKALYGSAYLAPSPFQAYAHYGSFYSVDGGQTYASSFWHLPNPDLKPQEKKTTELSLSQALGTRFQLTASGFYSRFTNLIRESDATLAYAGLYRGWPVDYIDFPVNEGRATAYGATFGLDYVRSIDADRRLEARAAMTVVDGREWDRKDSPSSLPIGTMSPVQLRAGADIDWYGWSAAPRLSIVGPQRLRATTGTGTALKRRTLPGYGLLDVNVRRRLSRTAAAFLTVENALDRRYRTTNARAYSNPEELVGMPQNPRRLTLGVDLRIQ